jgi:hypothetical protein
MKISKLILVLIVCAFSVMRLVAQEVHTEFCIDFRVSSTVIDSAYHDNGARLTEMMRSIRELNADSTLELQEVMFCGTASPEGSIALNKRLATQRLKTLEHVVRKQFALSDTQVTYDNSYIPWDYLRAEVAASDLAYKNEILQILDDENKSSGYHHVSNYNDPRIVALMKLDQGRVWKQLNTLYFKHMRNACVVLFFYKRMPKAVLVEKVVANPLPVVDSLKIDSTKVDLMKSLPVLPQIPTNSTRQRNIYFKTNAVAWGFAIANAAIEIDLCKHLSLSVPVYYSAWDYFVSTLKFRTFSVSPEFRFWLNENSNGVFVGTHFGFTYYNFAFNRSIRYQDHSEKTPAIGGGMSLGYRMPMGKGKFWKHWKVECSVGYGAHWLYYDKFKNTDRTNLGPWLGSVKKVNFGIDQVNLSLSYSFDLKKLGGKR